MVLGSIWNEADIHAHMDFDPKAHWVAIGAEFCDSFCLVLRGVERKTITLS